MKQHVFYKDIAVVAYKLPEADKSLNDLGAVVTSSGGNFTLVQLTDGDLGTTNLLPRDSATGFGWIQFAFSQPQTIKAITMVGGGNPGVFGQGADSKDSRKLEASDDGINFKRVCYIPAGNVLQQTISFPAVTSKYFRVTVKNPPAPRNLGGMFGAGGEAPKPPKGTDIAEVVLHAVTRIHMFEEKDAFAPATDLYAKATPSSSDVIDRKSVV